MGTLSSLKVRHKNHSALVLPFFFKPFPLWYVLLQDQEGLAEEEVWSEIWLPDNLPQHGEDSCAKPPPSATVQIQARDDLKSVQLSSAHTVTSVSVFRSTDRRPS